MTFRCNWNCLRLCRCLEQQHHFPLSHPLLVNAKNEWKSEPGRKEKIIMNWKNEGNDSTFVNRDGCPTFKSLLLSPRSTFHLYLSFLSSFPSFLLLICETFLALRFRLFKCLRRHWNVNHFYHCAPCSIHIGTNAEVNNESRKSYRNVMQTAQLNYEHSHLFFSVAGVAFEMKLRSESKCKTFILVKYG